MDGLDIRGSCKQCRMASGKIWRMQLFSTPAEARQILLAMIFERAKRENVEFSDLERRLLTSTEACDTVTDREWQRLIEDEDEEFSDALSDKAATLIVH